MPTARPSQVHASPAESSDEEAEKQQLEVGAPVFFQWCERHGNLERAATDNSLEALERQEDPKHIHVSLLHLLVCSLGISHISLHVSLSSFVELNICISLFRVSCRDTSTLRGGSISVSKCRVTKPGRQSIEQSGRHAYPLKTGEHSVSNPRTTVSVLRRKRH